MAGITIDLSQFEPVLKKFATLSQELQEEIDGEIEASAKKFVELSKKSLASSLSANNNKKTGRLYNSINTLPINGVKMSHEIFVLTNYAAYNEWGTINYVSVPADLVDIAIKYKGRGIRKTGGMKPKNYFYSQRAIVIPELINNLNTVIESTLGK